MAGHFHFEMISADERLPCNMRDRARGMVSFVCQELSIHSGPRGGLDSSSNGGRRERDREALEANV